MCEINVELNILLNNHVKELYEIIFNVELKMEITTIWNVQR